MKTDSDAPAQTLEFVRPGSGMKEQAVAFCEVFYANGETVINGSGGLDFYDTYEEWLAYHGRVQRGEEEGFLPSEIYFARPTGSDEIIGVIDIRPGLQPHQRHYGHMGYAVAPAHRRKGVASQMVQWALQQLRQKGVKESIACCYESNGASRKTLENNGFSKQNSYFEEGTGKAVLMYTHR